MRSLEHLKRELAETESLLNSPRVNENTRYVLERLRDDLKAQIAAAESKSNDDPLITAGH